MLAFDVPSYEYQFEPFETRYKILISNINHDNPFSVILSLSLITMLNNITGGSNKNLKQKFAPTKDCAEYYRRRRRRIDFAKARLTLRTW
jgi:hypothetical protein